MSRIQQILEKAEREGAALRTSRLGPATATVPITIDIPTPPPAGVIVPGARPAAHRSWTPHPARSASRPTSSI